MALFLGQHQQFADFFREVNAGLGLDRACIQPGSFRRNNLGRNDCDVAIRMAVLVSVVAVLSAVGFLDGFGFGRGVIGWTASLFAGGLATGSLGCGLFYSRFNHIVLLRINRDDNSPSLSQKKHL